MKKKLGMVLIVCMMACLFTACGNAGSVAGPTPAVEPTSVPTPEPTATSIPTPTPEPTATSTPTPTPEPTLTPEPLEAAVYQKGTITENAFESEWMNLRFTAQKDVYMFSQEELDALMHQNGALYNEDNTIDYADLTTVIEMRAQYMGGAVVTVCTEKLPVLYYNTTDEQYLTAVISYLQNQGNASVESVGDFYFEEFAGEEYTCVHIELDYGVGYGISMDYMVRKLDKCFGVIVFNYATEYAEEGIRNLKHAFGSYDSEPVVLPEPTPYPNTYVMGTLTETCYESEWLGLRFNATEDVILSGRDEMAEMMPLGITMLYGEQANSIVDVSQKNLFHEMMALHVKGGNVLVQVEKLAPGCEKMSVEEYLVIVMNQLSAAVNVSYIVDEALYEKELVGEKYLGFSATTDSFGEELFQEFLCRKKENMMISFFLSYEDDTTMEHVEYLLSLFEKYDADFGEALPPTITEEDEKNIIIGQYKGLVLSGVDQAEVDAEIASMLDYYTQLVSVDRAAQTGDTVNIDFVGTKDGMAFDGGTAEGYELVLGSGSFIDGFEEGLIGAVEGEIRDLYLTFPENYSSAELAGQDVVFTVTVNDVMVVQYPELTDEFVAQEFPEYATVAEYIEAVRDALNQEAYYEQITEMLMASSEVIAYDEAVVAARKQDLIDDYSAYAYYYGSYYGLDEETSIMYFLGYESMEAFEADMGVYAYDVEKNAMIMEEIALLENLEVTQEIYNNNVVEMAAYYGYEDIAEFEDANGVDAIKEAILSELVMNFIIENAVITEAE